MRARIRSVVLVLVLASSACAVGAEGPVGPGAAPPPPPYAGSVPDGQWVQTQQYGWVWMPYADPYTYVPPDGVGEPLEYVYYPAQGWVWVSAPWVWGVGPSPSFGRRGPDRFAWYGHGWWRTPRRWSYRPAPEPSDRRYAHGVRPAPRTYGPAPGRPVPAPGRAPPAPAPQARSAPAPAPRPEERRGGDQRGGNRGDRGRGKGDRGDRGDERGRPDGDRDGR